MSAASQVRAIMLARFDEKAREPPVRPS